MIILTIGLMVLSQFISMRSQKESAQYQTLDGKGAKTQKIMLIAIPLIYAITGFMWTAAFSLILESSPNKIGKYIRPEKACLFRAMFYKETIKLFAVFCT